MKKIVQLFVLVFIITLLSCSGRDPKKIVVWHSCRLTDRAVMREALTEFFDKHPGWSYNDLYYEPEQARTNYIISALGGSGPDLFWGANDNIGPFVELGVIQPLENLFSQTYIDSFLTDPIQANTVMNGHLYHIADRIGNHLCLVYNKALISKPPETMSELIEMGKEFGADEDGDGRSDKYILAWNFTEPFFFIPFMGGYGGWMINDQNQPTLNTEATIKAAQLIYDLANKHKVIPKECDYEIANALFKDGLAAMIINGSWSWGSYIDNGIDLGIAKMPKIDETDTWPVPAISTQGYSLNVNLVGEKLEMSKKLLKFLTSDEVMLRFTKSSGAIPARTAAYNSPLVSENEIVSAALDQLLVGRIMPPVTEMRWIWDAMRPSYQGIFTGRVTPDEAAEQMQAQALKLIKENRE